MTSERESLVQTKKSTENKVIPRSQLALQVEASTQTLPDESDLIIHELNQKLNYKIFRPNGRRSITMLDLYHRPSRLCVNQPLS